MGGKVAVTIDSNPSSALITVNGMVKGSAPVNIEVEIDDLGDVAVDLDLTASFSDSPTGSKSLSSAVVSYRIARGERPPSVVNFDTDNATAR
jgi:hypothetical protein